MTFSYTEYGALSRKWGKNSLQQKWTTGDGVLDSHVDIE